MRASPAHYRLSLLLPDGAELFDVPTRICGLLIYGAGLIVIVGPSRDDVLDYAGSCLLAWCVDVTKPCSITASIRAVTERHPLNGLERPPYELLTVSIDRKIAFHPAAPPLVPELPPPQPVQAPG